MDENKVKQIVVDENDCVLGAKYREELEHPNDIFRTAALWITNSKGQFLLAQRVLTKSTDPGMWGPAVSGTVDEGETYESNIYKEAEEEINLVGYKFEKINKVFIQTESHRYFVQWYKACIDEPTTFFTILPDEVMDLKWIDKEEFLKDVKENPKEYIFGVRNYLDILAI